MKNRQLLYKNAYYKILFKDKKCKFCGLRLELKEYANSVETASHYNNRQYCDTKCQYKAFAGTGNPNYKGIMPKCIDCGKSIAYPSKSSKQAKRCKKCFATWTDKTNYYPQTAQAKKIAEKMRQSKGVTPKVLKPFLFKKGQKAHNFIGGTCKVEGCNKPFLAKGFCSMHYQRNAKNHLT